MKYILGSIAFMIIWVIGCLLQDVVFKIESGSYVMFYGYAVGSISYLAKCSLEKSK